VSRTVTIDCFHQQLPVDGAGCAVVAVDVIRASTTAVTAAALGRRCFPVHSVEAAVTLAERLEDPLLAGELGGVQPYGFHLQNSPSAIERLPDSHRPVVLLSTSGTRLMWEAASRTATYAACLRNQSAQASHLAAQHDNVMLLGAESRGEFREEDQLCCARIATRLLEAGYVTADSLTEEVIARWGQAPERAFVGGRSTQYLQATGQQQDLDFILGHVDDIDAVFPIEGGELLMTPVMTRSGTTS
jgi:2-phosphosulfolactate phosphatase